METISDLNKNVKLKSYKDDLLEQLKDPEFAAAYLADLLESGDKAAFLIALKDVVEASGGVSSLAQQARLQRQSLYKALSKRGNPTLNTLQGVLKTLGLRISVTPKSKRSVRRTKKAAAA